MLSDLSLKSYKETIDSEDRLFGWHGWDIKKALIHLKNMYVAPM